MWETVIDMLVTAVTAAFNWMSAFFNAAPGSWDALFTLFVIVILSRFLLGPLLGVAFGGRSDKAKKSGDKENG